MRDEDKTKEQLINELLELRQQNETLIITEKRYSSIFENTKVGIYQSSPEGNYIMANPAFACIFGYDSPEELLSSVTDIGRQLYVNTEDHGKCIQQVLEHGSYSCEVHVYRKDGSKAWISNNVHVVRNNNDNIVYFEGVAIDITQRKKAKDKLKKANEKLQKEITEREKIEGKLKLSEARLEALLKLNQMTEEPLKEITDFSLEKGIRLSGSSIGYIAFFDEDTKELKMHSWSKSSMEECVIIDKPVIYQLEKTGLWGEAVRQRKPVVTNDYSAPNLFKKGYPKGHVHLLRHMNIPVFDGQRIVFVAGVGNKKEDYDESDVNQLNLLMSGMWRIIQRKRAEEALRESEVNYRTIFNAANDAIFVHNIETGDIIDTNQKVNEMFGYSQEDTRHLNLVAISSGEPQIILKNAHSLMTKAAKGEPQIFEWPAKHKSGRLFWVEVNLKHAVIGGKDRLLAILRDITKRKLVGEELEKHRNHLEDMVDERTAQLQTALAQLKLEIVERKRAEETIRENEERFRRITDNMLDMLRQTDVEGIIQYASPSHKNILGFEPKELLGKSAFEFIHPDDKNRVMEAFQRAISTSVAGKAEYRVRHANDQYLWVNTTGNLLFDNNGLITGAVFCSRDITERKRAEEALRLSEERFSKAFYSCPCPMSITTLSEGRYINVNDIYLEFIGRPLDEVIGHSSLELNLWARPEDRIEMLTLLKEHGKVHNLQINFCTMKGESRIGLYSAEAIYINGEGCILSIVNDITDSSRMKNEMARLDRLNLIGEMAAGIAHEIRNPMTTIRGFLQMLGGNKENLRNKEYYQLMIEELDRANSIVSEFLSLARNKTVDLEMQNLNSIVEAIFPLIQADAMVTDNYINLEQEKIPDLLLNEKEMRQLILNLVRNGFEAMPSGEYLTIRTYLDDSEVVLSVQDRGKGMPVDILHKIGTPFFTTKDNGTGLGLATCYSIANRNNASIQIDTGPEGTTFYVRFKVST